MIIYRIVLEFYFLVRNYLCRPTVLLLMNSSFSRLNYLRFPEGNIFVCSRYFEKIYINFIIVSRTRFMVLDLDN